MTIQISLTQFLHFKATVSTKAKINYLRNEVKYSEYAFYGDYWMGLRKKIHKFTKGEITLDDLKQYSLTVSDKKNKRKNYIRDTKYFLSFVKKYDPHFFQVDKAFWNYKDKLIITASPEFGAITNSRNKYLIKNFYTKKKDNEKLMKNNILPMLTMMKLANTGANSSDAIPAVLNLQNGKLIYFDEDKGSIFDPIELQVDAENIINIWNMI